MKKLTEFESHSIKDQNMVKASGGLWGWYIDATFEEFTTQGETSDEIFEDVDYNDVRIVF